MRYQTQYLSEEEKITVLKQIIRGGIKGSIHDTIHLPTPLKGNDLTALPNRQGTNQIPKWPITPFREVSGKLIQKGYSELEFHTRVAPFPVDPGTDNRDYLIGPATTGSVAAENEDRSISTSSDNEKICFRKISYQKKISGDNIPTGYTEAPRSTEKLWDVLYIPELTEEMRASGEKTLPVLARDVNRDGLLQIFKRSEAFYIVDKKDASVKGFALSDLEEKSDDASPVEPGLKVTFLLTDEMDDAYKNYAQGFGISAERQPPEFSREEKEKYLKSVKKEQKKLFQYLRELAAHAYECADLTDKELRLLYDNGYLVISDEVKEQGAEWMQALVCKFLEGKSISDRDLLSLYRQGLFEICTKQCSKGSLNETLQVLMAKAARGVDMMEKDLRLLFDNGCLVISDAVREQSAEWMKILVTKFLEGDALSNVDLQTLYAQGLFEIRAKDHPTSNLNQTLQELMAHAYEGVDVTDQDLRLLYDNECLSISEVAMDKATEWTKAVISKFLKGNAITNLDLQTLFHEGLFEIRSKECSKSCDMLKKLIAVGKGGGKLTGDQLRHLHANGCLTLLSKAEKLVDFGMKNLLSQAAKNTDLTDQELRFLYNEGLFKIRTAPQQFQKPGGSMAAFIDSLSHEDVRTLCQYGLRSVPDSVVKKFLGTEMKALGAKAAETGHVTPKLLRKLYHRGFERTNERLKKKLLEDGYRGSKSDGTQLNLLEDGYRRSKSDGTQLKLEPLTMDGNKMKLNHETDLCALTRAMMTSKDLIGRDVFIGDNASTDEILKRFQVGRHKFFRGPSHGLSGGAGRGATHRKFQRGPEEPADVGLKKTRALPKFYGDAKKRDKRVTYCLACFINKGTSSDKLLLSQSTIMSQVETLLKSSSDKKREQESDKATAQPTVPRERGSISPARVLVGFEAEGVDPINHSRTPRSLSDQAEVMAHEQLVQKFRSQRRTTSEACKEKTRTIGDLVPSDARWLLSPLEEPLQLDGRAMSQDEIDERKARLHTYYSIGESYDAEMDEKKAKLQKCFSVQAVDKSKKESEDRKQGDDSLLSWKDYQSYKELRGYSRDAAKPRMIQRDGSVHCRGTDGSPLLKKIRDATLTDTQRMTEKEEAGLLFFDSGRTCKRPSFTDTSLTDSAQMVAGMVTRSRDAGQVDVVPFHDKLTTFTSKYASSSSDRRKFATDTQKKKIVRDKRVVPATQMKKEASKLEPVLTPSKCRVIGKKTATPVDEKKVTPIQGYPKFKRKKKGANAIKPKIQKKPIVTDRISSVDWLTKGNTKDLSPELLRKSLNGQQLLKTRSIRPDDVAEIDMGYLQAMDEQEMRAMLIEAGLIIEEQSQKTAEDVDSAKKSDSGSPVPTHALSQGETITDMAEEQAAANVSDKKSVKSRDKPRRYSSIREEFLFPFGRPTEGIGISAAFMGMRTKTKSLNLKTRNAFEDHEEIMKEIKDSILQADDDKRNYLGLLQMDGEQAPWFEFPINLNELNDMHPRNYMKKFCIINPRRLPIYNRIFRRFREVDNTMTKQKLLRGINELVVGNYTLPQMEKVMQLLQCAELQRVDEELFLSVACLAERLADRRPDRTYTPPRNYLAELDETVVLAHLEKLEVNRPLYDLLRAIIGDE